MAEAAAQDDPRIRNAFRSIPVFARARKRMGAGGAVDKYIVENEPWALGEKQDEDSRSRLATVLYTAAEALRIATALAHPVMPDSTAKIWEQMGLGDIQKLALSELEWGQLQLGTKLGGSTTGFSARRQERN